MLEKEQVVDMIWSQKVPLYKHFKVSRCKTHGHILKKSRTNFEPKSFKSKSRKCMFLGYRESSEMDYQPWYLEPRKILYGNDVFFNKENFL